MVEHDLRTVTSGVNAVPPAEYAVTVISGSAIDTLGHESLHFYTETGVVTDGTYTVSLVEGDTASTTDRLANGAMTAVDASEILGSNPTIALTQDNSVHAIGTNSKKRYVALKITGAGVSSGGFFSSTAVLGHPKVSPTP